MIFGSVIVKQESQEIERYKWPTEKNTIHHLKVTMDGIITWKSGRKILLEVIVR